MKTKLVLIWAIILLGQKSFAQLSLGDAVVTMCDYQGTGRTVKIFNVTDTSGAPRGDNWGLTPTPDYPTWNSSNLGQVFGIAINTTDADHTIYVSNTQAYPQTGALTYPNGLQNYPTPSPAGVVLIWALNPSTGSYTPLVTSTLAGGTLTSHDSTVIFNCGSGLGNICYDKIHDQIFATNMEDGRIYRIKAATGKILSRLDPFRKFTYVGTNIPKVVDLGERIWGIGFDNHFSGQEAKLQNKLYFAQWNTDLGDQNSTANAIYSVGIDYGTGEFIATVGSSIYEYLDSLPHLEITIPQIATSPANAIPYSNPVSDIKISSTSGMMLLAEKTMSAEAGGAGLAGVANLVGTIAEYWAHRARVLRYNASGNTWTASGNNYFVGNYALTTNTGYTPVNYRSTNCSGGVDFGMNFSTKAIGIYDSCVYMVWATGDALKHPSFPGGSNPGEYVYGIAGIPLSGNSVYGASGPPQSEDLSSIYQDMFSNNVGGYQSSKGLPGDIQIYREACFNDVAVNTVAAPEILTCYPNPFSNVFTLKFDNYSSERAVIDITDNIGNIVRRTENLNYGPNQLNINLSDLASGFYIVKVSIGDKLKVAKVVKE